MLSDSFAMGTIGSWQQCDFSGKAIVLRCNGKILDANRAGRFAYGKGSGSSDSKFESNTATHSVR